LLLHISTLELILDPPKKTHISMQNQIRVEWIN